jgi:uridylate kinase
MESHYKPEKIHRVIIKISGEFLAGKQHFGFHQEALSQLVEDLVEVKNQGYSIGVVLGGGNIFRGGAEMGNHLERYTADNVGMLATIQNALIIAEMLYKKNYQTDVFSAIQIDKMAKFFTPKRALTSMNEGRICFFCAGTGNPYFTTDTAAVLRALELKANLVLKGTKVDGIYTKDPMVDKTARFIPEITFQEALSKQLNVMDMTAFSLARENTIPIKVFNITKKGNLKLAIQRKDVGSFIY